uniref:Major facilitator superfamily (MFS) profile domain-containing protein n=1 Tax=Aegilops tauschii subsp. strangulata TaxID=200361 RepID=A0A453PUK9_AEGTS
MLIELPAGFDSGNLGTILMACIQLPLTTLGALLMDRSGRKPLLLVSTSGLIVGTLMSAVSFYLKVTFIAYLLVLFYIL